MSDAPKQFGPSEIVALIEEAGKQEARISKRLGVGGYVDSALYHEGRADMAKDLAAAIKAKMARAPR
jgi:hypothetical protein